MSRPRPMLRDLLAVTQPDRIRLHHAAVSVEALLSIVRRGITPRR